MKHIQVFIVLVTLMVAGSAVCQQVPDKNERQAEQVQLDGFKDTPMQPGDKWHVHDPDRPQPPVAEPKYDGKPVPAPKNAVIIFDGKDSDELTNKTWPIKDGVMVAGRKSQVSKSNFGDMHLHVEFLIPVACLSKGWGQKQGNSGIFLMNTYEVQVLNGWGNRTYPDGMIGALYGHQPPLVNASKKPGEWQCYDIDFTAPVFNGKEVVSPAKVTVYLNNVLVQDKSEFNGASTFKRVPTYKPHPQKMPLGLQSHANPISYRNIWVVSKDK